MASHAAVMARLRGDGPADAWLRGAVIGMGQVVGHIAGTCAWRCQVPSRHSTEAASRRMRLGIAIALTREWRTHRASLLGAMSFAEEANGRQEATLVLVVGPELVDLLGHLLREAGTGADKFTTGQKRGLATLFWDAGGAMLAPKRAITTSKFRQRQTHIGATR